MKNSHFYNCPDQFIEVKDLGKVCRLGLATHGNTHLDCEAVETAIDRGGWPGHVLGVTKNNATHTGAGLR